MIFTRRPKCYKRLQLYWLNFGTLFRAPHRLHMLLIAHAVPPHQIKVTSFLSSSYSSFIWHLQRIQKLFALHFFLTYHYGFTRSIVTRFGKGYDKWSLLCRSVTDLNRSFDHLSVWMPCLTLQQRRLCTW
jgi:hypothetical protein